MHHFTAIDALPAVRPQESTPEPGARISVFASEGELPHGVAGHRHRRRAPGVRRGHPRRRPPRRDAPARRVDGPDPRDGHVVSDFLLKTVHADGTAWGGFQWPLDEGAEVTAPDWDPTPVCGGGLHGLLNGAGSGSPHRLVDRRRLDRRRDPDDETVVDLDGKVKVRRCIVRHVGDKTSALNSSPLTATPKGGLRHCDGRGRRHCDGRGRRHCDGRERRHCDGRVPAALRRPGSPALPGTARVPGTATAGTPDGCDGGDAGTATAGDDGTATAGHYDSGTATAGDYGAATAGSPALRRPGHRDGTADGREPGYGTATAGYRGTATGGVPAPRRPGTTAAATAGGPALRRPGTAAPRRPGTPALRRPGRRHCDGRGRRHCDGRGTTGDATAGAPLDPSRRPGTAIALRRPGTTALRRPGTTALRRPGDSIALRRPGTTALRRPGTTAVHSSTTSPGLSGDETAGPRRDGRGLRRCDGPIIDTLPRHCDGRGGPAGRPRTVRGTIIIAWWDSELGRRRWVVGEVGIDGIVQADTPYRVVDGALVEVES